MAPANPGLAKLKRPIAIRRDCITSQRTRLLIKQDRSWSNGDYNATTEDGKLILSCEGKYWSCSARKLFKDASGLPLYSLRSSHFSMSQAWRLELPGDGQLIMAVRERWSPGKLKLDCSFTNAASDGAGQEVTLEVRGQNWRDTVTHISHEGNLVASVRRKGGNVLWSKPVFEVDVAEGMDMALVAVIVVVEDTIRQSNVNS